MNFMCIFGGDGVAVRLCMEEGGWKDSDLSQCFTDVTASFMEIGNVSSRLNVFVVVHPLLLISSGDCDSR